jgi:hypothetical protein
MTSSSNISFTKIEKKIDFKDKFVMQNNLDRIEDEKKKMIIKSLEFMVSDSKNSRIWRLTRPTASSK